MSITIQEQELISLLRSCGPHDEVRVIVGENKEGLIWTVLMAKNSKKVLSIPYVS